MPLPHILYSALSVWSLPYHLSVWAFVYSLTSLPSIAAWVLRTSSQKRYSSSVKSSFGSMSPHQSANPWSLAHSIGVRRRTIYRIFWHCATHGCLCPPWAVFRVGDTSPCILGTPSWLLGSNKTTDSLQQTVGGCPWAANGWHGSPHFGLFPFWGLVTCVVSKGMYH